MARWRTLHEITVVAFFIAEHGDDLAERYLLHHVVESWRAARDYVQCQERMGYPPLSPKQLSKIEGQFNKLIGRFGTPFRTHYGWAVQQLSLPSPTFGDIEKAVGIGHFRSHYRMASHPVHASPHGVLFSLAVVGDSAPLLAGPSDTGLPDPGWLTANSLVQVSAAIGGLSPTIDNIVTLMVMERMKKEVSATLDAAWEQIQRRPIPGPAL
jgi:hypothetical protein